MSRKNTLTLNSAVTVSTAVATAPADLAEKIDTPVTTLPAAEGASSEATTVEDDNEQATASAEANQGEKPEAPAVESTSKAPAWKIGDVVEIVAVYGSLQHLHTGDLFGAAPVSAEIDAFLSLQLDAGKLAIVPSAT